VIVEEVFKGGADHARLHSRLDEPKYNALNSAGYKFANSFCGTIPEGFTPALSNCHVVFEYAAGAPGSGESAGTASPF
jgi:hypothetical protein